MAREAIAAITVFAGFNLTFFPQFILGYLGMPRRYHVYAPEFQVLNVLSTRRRVDSRHRLLPSARLSRFGHGDTAKSRGLNPWQATGLEWTTPSPPPKDNFEVTPVVTEGPYEYDPVAAEAEWKERAMSESLAAPPIEQQFDDAEQQREAATMGMWVFLATEVLFFGGMFLGYTVYRISYPAAFAEASRHTLILFGSINTAVLLISSTFMALAVRAARQNRRALLGLLLLITAGLGLAFLVIKGFEYAREISEHLLPGAGFRIEAGDPTHAEMFFYIYWLMTGVHALHVTIGVLFIGLFAFRARFTNAFLESRHACRLARPLLAFRRYRLGLSLPTHLPGGPAFMNSTTRTYWTNGAVLLAFLALTIGAAYVNLGPFNTIVAMLIAAAKAMLIVLFFMHLRQARPLMWIVAGAGVFWLGIMIALALSDYLTRGWR